MMVLFHAKVWKTGTGLVVTIPQTFVKSGQIYEGDEVRVEIKEV